MTTRTVLRSVCILAVVAAVSFASRGVAAQGATATIQIKQRGSATTDSLPVALPARATDLVILLDHAHRLTLLSNEFERFTRMVVSDSVAKARPEAFARQHSAVFKSLQKHATETVVTINQICRSSAAPATARGAYLGVEIEEFDRRLEPKISISEIPYPTVVGVEPTSPAAEAGLEKGDVIKKVNGEDLRGISLARFITSPGKMLELAIDSEGKERRVSVRLAPPVKRYGVPMTCEVVYFNSPDVKNLLQRDSIASRVLRVPRIVTLRDTGQTRTFIVQRGDSTKTGRVTATFGGVGFAAALTPVSPQTYLGASFFPASTALLERRGAKNGGVAVAAVIANSAWARGGLESGDIVVRLGKTPVTNMTQLKTALDANARDATVDVEIIREQKAQKLSIRMR